MQDNRKLRRKVRNSYIISTVSISLVLFLLGSIGYLILSALDTTDRMKESIAVYVMLKDGLDQPQKDDIGKKLLAHEAVKDVLYVPREQAAEEFREYAGGDFEQFLEFNPLPDSYEIKLNAQGPDIEKLEAFEKEALQWQGVDEVVYQRNIIEQIGNNISKFNLVILLFGGALLVISLILLNNTIRVTIYSKRYIISTMKLVGASRGFIVKPFMWSAVRQGIFSAIIASLMFVGMVWGLNEGLPEIRFTTGMNELLVILGGMFVVGILISLIFTIFAVNKFVKMPTGAVNYY